MTTFRTLCTLAGLLVLSGTMTPGVASAQTVAAPAERACIGIVEEKIKAAVDGEDLITPLVGRAAEGIVAGLTRK